MKSKCLFFILIFTCLSYLAIAQIPERFNYQCVLRDANGDVLANTGVTVRFSILHVNGGSVAYQEKHSTTTSELGLVNLEIGTGDVTQFSWNNLDWWGFEYQLQVEVDLGDGFVDMGTSEFGTVPFSMLSEKAVNMNLGDLTDVETYMGASDGQVLRFNADENWWEPGRPSLDDLSDVNYEEQPVDGDRLVYSDYYAEWVPSSVVPGYVEGAWSTSGANTFVTTGLVGVGTNTPWGKLHVNDGSLRISKTEFGSGLIDGLNIGQDATGNSVFANYESTDMIFSTGFTERFRLGATGPILPLDYPGNKFHIKSTYPGLGMHLTYTNSGHTETDGARIGLNGSSQLEINQQENQDIIFKRNGTTRATITNSGLDVNGTVDASSIDATVVEAFGMDTYQMDTENLYIHSAEGSGNRPLYATAGGQVYAQPSVTKYYNIGPADFIAESPDDAGQLDPINDYTVGGDFGEYQFRYEENNGVEFYAHIHLPHGATPISAKAYFYDTEEERTIFVTLSDTDVATGETNASGVFDLFLESSGSNGFVSDEKNFYPAPTIDNQTKMYFAVITVVGEVDLDPNIYNMRFISLVIEYTE